MAKTFEKCCNQHILLRDSQFSFILQTVRSFALKKQLDEFCSFWVTNCIVPMIPNKCCPLKNKNENKNIALSSRMQGRKCELFNNAEQTLIYKDRLNYWWELSVTLWRSLFSIMVQVLSLTLHLMKLNKLYIGKVY